MRAVSNKVYFGIKKQKIDKRKMSLSDLPDEIILNIFQFNTNNEIKKTQTNGFPSKFVKQRTMFVEMKEAIRANNFGNMQWIKERYNTRTRWKRNITIRTFFLLVILKPDNN